MSYAKSNFVISFALGLWIIAYFYHVPPAWVCAGITLLLILLTGLSWSTLRKYLWLKILCLSICGFSLGFSWTDYQANQWLINRLPTNLVGKNIPVLGVIAELPIEEKNYTRFLVNTEQFAGQALHKRLQLSWQNPHPAIHAGERWALTVRLKPPHALVNFNAFNRLRFLWSPQHIHAVGYVVSKQAFRRLSTALPGFWLMHLREQLQHEIQHSVPDSAMAAIISALTIGVEHGLTDADWQILQRTGTVHLVVIAGLHIGLMVMVAYFLGNRLWRCSPKLLLRLPAQHAGTITALIFALSYGALAGFGIPTQRAVIMIIVLAIAQLSYRTISVWHRISLALVLVLAFQPGALFSAGFWLSFGAVAWISYSVSGEWRKVAHWRQWLRMQWSLFLGLMPLTIYFFHQFSLVSMLANLPAIIWIGWVIVPLCILAAVTSGINLAVSQWLFAAAAYLLIPLWHFLQWLAAWSFASGHRAFSNQWILAAALLGAAWCLAPQNRLSGWLAKVLHLPHRAICWLGLFGFLPIWLVRPPQPVIGTYWLTMLDVGQGLAITVQTAHHFLVYDAGAHIPDGFDAGRDIVSPYLQTLGVNQIDLLMISHGDNDHSGGAKALLEAWPVQRFLTSIPSMFADGHPEYCGAGQQWQWDGVPFRVLSPPLASAYQDNNSSCVLQIGAPGNRTLLTGDIEASTEIALAIQYGDDLKSQIIQVPHHGSSTSSTQQLLKLVQPKYALFSLGYFNRFHFPTPRVVARYQAIGASQWLTAANGAIKLRVSPNQPVLVETANPRHYFWQQ